jgi:next-to-BRCA1 protein 1
VVKVRRADDSEIRRFSWTGASFADLTHVVRQVFALPAGQPVDLKYKDDEGDLVCLSSDAELHEAMKFAAGGLLTLVLGNKQAVSNAPSAPLSAPTVTPPPAAVITPGAPVAPVAAIPEAAPAKPKGWGARGQWKAHWKNEHAGEKAGEKAGDKAAGWKEEKGRMVERFKSDKEKLHAAVKQLKESKAADKERLKGQVQVLRTQLREHKQELKRMPREAVMGGRFVADVTLPDGTEVPPGAKIVKTWRFRNETGKAWPEGTKLVWVGKKCDRLGAPEEIAVPLAQPGQEVDISVPLCFPEAPGRYNAYFRLCGPMGRKFGQRVWVMATVLPDSSGDEKEKSDKCGATVTANVSNDDLVKYATHLKALNDMGYTQVNNNVRLLKRFDGNLEKVAGKLIKRQQMKGAWRNA